MPQLGRFLGLTLLFYWNIATVTSTNNIIYIRASFYFQEHYGQTIIFR